MEMKLMRMRLSCMQQLMKMWLQMMGRINPLGGNGRHGPVAGNHP